MPPLRVQRGVLRVRGHPREVVPHRRKRRGHGLGGLRSLRAPLLDGSVEEFLVELLLALLALLGDGAALLEGEVAVAGEDEVAAAVLEEDVDLQVKKTSTTFQKLKSKKLPQPSKNFHDLKPRIRRQIFFFFEIFFKYFSDHYFRNF